MTTSRNDVLKLYSTRMRFHFGDGNRGLCESDGLWTFFIDLFFYTSNFFSFFFFSSIRFNGFSPAEIPAGRLKARYTDSTGYLPSYRLEPVITLWR